ncbi:MAG TPA: MBL fold metallo-hydrolase [Candidatus Enterocloster excrementipullorum]|uniref:MBL fold metallo-hydrolase n=1 Tax=Candidatus Enterocloster excrementipullorum TaxID=2838559 RepID=A0A9D2SJ31_9FIRM|nr:MBL fold metallo-hydrolase [Candidatus Enterocloster excrementipullorum]
MAEILFQGHGSFRVTAGDGTVIYIDPYAGEGYDIPADMILVSHEHSDHNQVDLVTRKAGGRILRAGDFLKEGVYREIAQKGIVIRGVQAYNKNHPRSSCVGFLMYADGKKLYFAGDTSRTEAMEKELAAEHIDYAFLPIDGIYNMGPAEASACAGLIRARHTIPVHMAPGKLFDQTAAEQFEAEGRIILRPGEKICW